MLPEECNAIRSLRRNREIVILPADKSNATVILNSTDYDKKMMELLQDKSTYIALKKDPTLKVERELQKHLAYVFLFVPPQHKALYYRLLCHNGSAPVLYGLPKIHKEGVPMRPIVDFTRSPLCQLLGYLHRVFAPLVGKGPTLIRNSFDFTEKVRDVVVEYDDIIVSFDVTSLFTSVPVDLAVDVCAAALQNDEKLSERTPLEAQDLSRLLKFCLENTYFVFRGSFYKQVHGTAMGASISVTAANLTMEAIENRALASFHPRPNVFLRYIDDCFCIVKKDALAAFTRHINSMEKAIQFTVEEEVGNQLPFLDVLVERVGHNLSFRVFRKSTHTGRFWVPPHPLPNLGLHCKERSLLLRLRAVFQDVNAVLERSYGLP
ncbi:uncharacterized protein LOC144119728 [Amblyomma americanum]